jgi:hypothetical protein
MSKALPELTKNMVKALRALYKERRYGVECEFEFVEKYLKKQGVKFKDKAYFQMAAFLGNTSAGNFHTAEAVRRQWKEFWLRETIEYRVMLEVEAVVEVPRCLIELGKVHLVMDSIDVDVDAYPMLSDLRKLGFTTQEAKAVRSSVTSYVEECDVESYGEEG